MVTAFNNTLSLQNISRFSLLPEPAVFSPANANFKMHSYINGYVHEILDETTENLPTCSLNDRYKFDNVTLKIQDYANNFKSIESEINNLFGDSALTLDQSDPRPKLLYFMGRYDPDGAFKVSNRVGDMDWGISPLLKSLDTSHDIQFKIIERGNQICEEIAEAFENGLKIKSIVIEAHGSPTTIRLSEKNVILLNTLGKVESLRENCFSGLDENAEIILFSCNTGEYENGIASALAKLSQKVVWAPSTEASAPLTKFSLNSPPEPTFKGSNSVGFFEGMINALTMDRDFSRNFAESTCKFFPDGSRSCIMLWQKTIPRIYSITVNYLFNFFQ